MTAPDTHRAQILVLNSNVFHMNAINQSIQSSEQYCIT